MSLPDPNDTNALLYQVKVLQARCDDLAKAAREANQLRHVFDELTYKVQILTSQIKNLKDNHEALSSIIRGGVR